MRRAFSASSVSGFFVTNGEGGEDVVYRLFETQVDHAVGFVHNYVAALFENDDADGRCSRRGGRAWR